MSKLIAAASRMILPAVLCLVSFGIAASRAVADPTEPQAGPPAGELPNIESEKPEHDFGPIWAGDELKHTFLIRNTGKADLQIVKVQPACGCTSAGTWPSSIAPGETGAFPFTIDSKKVGNGPFEKSIRIDSNDPDTPQYTLKFRGTTKWLIEVTPSVANFSQLTTDLPREVMLTVRNNGDQPLTLEPVPNQGSFSADVVETIPGKEFKLFVGISPPFTPGSMNSVISLKTNNPKQPLVTVQTFARIPDRIEVMPQYLSIRKPVGEPADQAATRVEVVQITNNSSSPMKVESVTCDDDKLKVTCKEGIAGRTFRVLVQIPAGYEPPDKGRTISLRIDHPDKQAVHIPISNASKAAAAETRRYPAEDMIGQASPAFSLTSVSGAEVSSGELVKHPATVLNFVAPNCGYCKRQVPVLEKIRQEYESKGVRFVNMIQTMRQPFPIEESKKIFEATGSKIDLANDENNQVGRLFKVSSFPTMFVVNGKGVVQNVHVGAAANLDQTLKAELDVLLKPPPAAADTANKAAAAG